MISVNASDGHGRDLHEGLLIHARVDPWESSMNGDVKPSRASFDSFFPQLRDLAFISSPPNEGVILWNIKGESESPCTWRNG